MDKVIIFLIVLLIIVATFYFLPVTEEARKSPSSSVIAIYSDREIIADNLVNNVPPLIYNAGAKKQSIQKQKLAYFTQELVYTQLTESFRIDVSDSAIIAFANRKFNNIFNPTEKQLRVTEIYIQALREVVKNKRSIRDVYNEYFEGKTFYDSKASITFDEWKKYSTPKCQDSFL